jgi:hypothetical protein
MALRQRYPISVKLNASGSGAASFTARGDVLITSMRTVVTVPSTTGNPTGTPVLQSTAMVEINGDDLDGSQTANNDTSDTQHLMLAGDVLICTWSGGDVGATATLTIWAIQYPAGQGIAAIAGAG